MSPHDYSFYFCVFELALFLVDAILLIKKDDSEFVGFNLLFTIAFLGANYVYPVLVYPILPQYSLFVYEINYDVISKSTALATMAYCIYAYGYSCQLMGVGEKKPNIESISILDYRQMRLVTIVEILLLILFVSLGGLNMFSEMYSHDENSSNPIVSFLYLIFYNFTLFFSITNIDLKDKLGVSILLAVISLLFLTGTRTLPLLVISILFCSFCYKYSLSRKKVITLLLLGFVLLSVVGKLRGGEMSSSKEEMNRELGFVSAAEDFIVVNRNLYDIYQHVQEDGITYGVSSLSYIVSVVPFAQSVISKVFDIPEYEMRSESLVTYWNLGEDSTLGLGTNIVGDVYLSFGLLGVIVLFYFLGRIVVYTRNGAFCGNWISFVVYYVLISGAIFMCRGSFFYSFKNIIWTLGFMYFFMRINIKIDDNKNEIDE